MKIMILSKMLSLSKKMMLPIIVLTSALLLSGCSLGKGGTHTGYITAVEQNGLIWKNYHVYVKTDRTSSQEDSYCVLADERELAEQLRAFQKNKQNVTITYDTDDYFFSLGRCSGDRITKVESDN